MHPVTAFVIGVMARNVSNTGDSKYFDSLNVPNDVERITSVSSGIINTTIEDGLEQLSGLAVLLINGQSPSNGIMSTVASSLPTSSVNWLSLGVMLVLSVIVLLTIGGNLLILAAVLFNSNLRGPTHILIANLAVADLLLGFLVLPFSATLEVEPSLLVQQTLYCSEFLFQIEIYLIAKAIARGKGCVYSRRVDRN